MGKLASLRFSPNSYAKVAPGTGTVNAHRQHHSTGIAWIEERKHNGGRGYFYGGRFYFGFGGWGYPHYYGYPYY